MNINNFDRISPPVNLFFNGYSRHPSIFSAILTLLAYAIILAFTINYFVELGSKKKPNIYSSLKYLEDAGSYPINSSSIFSFIQMTNKDTNKAKAIDFDSVRIIGIQDSIENYMSNNDLEKYNHWLYGNCNNNSDTEGIGHLINQDYFTQSACIRKYYDKNKGLYYNTDDINFKWPIVSKGNSNPERTSYAIIMEKCKNDKTRTSSGSGACKSEQDINNFIYSSSINFLVLDNSIDVLNYKKPFEKFLYPITNNILRNLISINNLNFNPALIKTDKGFIFDRNKEENSYFFTQNEKYILNDEVIPSNSNTDTNKDTTTVTDEKEPETTENYIFETDSTIEEDYDNIDSTDIRLRNLQDVANPLNKGTENNKVETGIFAGFVFIMQNHQKFYERKYVKFQDSLGYIGGLSNVIIFIAFLINSLVSNYIIILDIEDVILKLDSNNMINDEFSKKPKIYRKANQIMHPPRRQNYYGNSDENYNFNNKNSMNSGNTLNSNIYNDNAQQNSNYQRLMKDGVHVCQSNKDEEDISVKDEKTQMYRNLFKKRNNMLINYQKKKKVSEFEKYKSKNSMNDLHTEKKENYNDKYNDKYNDNENDKLNEKQNFSWCQYFKYFICCKTNNDKIAYYENLRKKLLSEENIIKDHFDLLKLLKVNNLEKKI